MIASHRQAGNGPYHRPVASMVVIGDEILDGFVEDANAAWMSARLREHGVFLQYTMFVRDSVPTIRDVVSRQILEARPRLIITSGGVGSTPDDVTYAAVAEALGRDLIVHPKLEERMRSAIDWVAARGYEPDRIYVESIMRMATVPRGSVPFLTTNWGGGVRIDLEGGLRKRDGATLVVLPGVPSQFRTIVESAVIPELPTGVGVDFVKDEISHDFPESLLNRCFVTLRQRFPKLTVGSYPGSPAVVRLFGESHEVAAASRIVREELRRLQDEDADRRIRDAWRAHAKQWHISS